MSGTDPGGGEFATWGQAADVPSTPPPSDAIHRGSWSAHDARRHWLAYAVIAAVCAVGAGLVVHFATSGSPSPRAIADAINLRLSDLPGFQLGSNAGVSTSGDPSAQFKQCFGGGVPDDGTPSFGSPDFDSGGGLQDVSVGSSVSFVAPSTLARDATLARDPRFPQCVSDALAAINYSAHGVQITGSNPTATTLPVPVSASASVDPVLGMRAAMTWTADGINIPVYIDVYLVGVGHDELSVFGFATQSPLSSSTAQRLVNLVVTRALAQPHAGT